MPVAVGTQYATRADLANLGLIGGTLTAIATGTQDAALIAASAVADSYLQGQYKLPLVQWGYDIARAVCIIAAYDLLTSKGYNPAAGADAEFGKRYDKAIAWLEQVGSGKDSAANVIDSSTPAVSDDTTQVDDTPGFQMVSSQVRGWTDRGDTAFLSDPWDRP